MIYHYELFQIINEKIDWDNKTITITENKDIIYTQLIHYDISRCLFESNMTSLNYFNINQQWIEHTKDCFTKWKISNLIQNKDYLLIPFYITSSTFYIAIILLTKKLINLPSFSVYGILSQVSKYDETLKIFKNVLETSYNDYYINLLGNIKINLNYVLKNIRNYLPKLKINYKYIDRINFMTIYNKKKDKKNL